MAYILHIETATTVCSVALSNKDQLLFSKELDDGYTHAENLHIFIQEALQEAGITTTQLQAIAVSKGPGSYTGLRIGVSAAKGLAFALNIPLLSVDTLQILSFQANSIVHDEGHFCPMIDARRMEVYTCVYNFKLEPKTTVKSLIVDELSVQEFNRDGIIYFFGNGMEKCKTLLKALPGARFIDNLKPSARYMVTLAYNKFLSGDFENTAYFEPFYLKDFMITKSKTKP